MIDTALPPAPPVTAILESGLYVEDLPAARAFYGGVLGLEEIAHVEGRHAFYRVGGAILLIFNPNATEKGSSGGKLPVPTHGARGPGHLCFAASREEMQAWSARLTAAGHPIESAFEWPNGAYSIYFRDPAGNSLEFAEPRLWF